MPTHIISASRRTDIPAFYAEWFMNRIRAGYCRVVNPLYPAQKTNPVDLTPASVECFVFWTRNPKPFLKYLDELDERGYAYYFLYTLIGYPRLFDPAVPDWQSALETFRTLSERIGADRVIWRYDPVILTDHTPVEWHQEQMGKIAVALQGFTRRMIFSFVIDYGHAKARYAAVKSHRIMFVPGRERIEQQEELARWIGRNLPRHGMTPSVCADPHDWSGYGIGKAQCIDGDLISRLTGQECRRVKDRAQRKDCACVTSRDIGANNSCLMRCFYCYATKDFAAARSNHARHDPNGEFLIDM